MINYSPMGAREFSGNSSLLTQCKQIMLMYIYYLTMHGKCQSASAQTYFQIGYDAQTYELREKVHETRQGETTVAQYYVELSSL